MPNDELYVLNEGSSVPVSSVVSGKPIMAVPSQYNYNASTNPRLVSVLQQANIDTEAAITSFVEIYDIDKTTLAINTSSPQFFPATLNHVTQNLYETPGYRVTLDIETTSPSMDLSTHDFYVLLNADSDEIYTHHFAKITEFNQYDDTQYSFDFEPKYGEVVPKNTNVTIYKGSSKSASYYNNLIAVSYGLKNDPTVTDDRHDQYVEVSRPTFYFYNNKDKLEPNKKYVAIKQCIGSGTGTVAPSVFKTAPVSSGMVLDKSFFTQNGTITDARKTADETNGTVTAWASNITNYDNRAGTNPISTYINFINSPPRNNLISAPASINIQTTITNRGNYFEATYIDPERAMEGKVMDNEGVSIKQNIGSDTIGEAPSFLLPGIMNNHTDSDKIAVTGLVDGQDLRDLLGSSATFEPIIIGSYYYLISAITAPVDGNQTITINNKRAVTDNTFGGSTTVETLSDSRAYRKMWSGKVENIGVTHEIDTSYNGANSFRNGTQVTEKEADVYNLEYYVGGDNNGITLKVSRGDKLNGFTTLQTIPAGIFNTTTNLMECIRSGFSYLKPIMDATVEVKETDTTGGVFSFKIGGRDDIAKLLDNPVNRNYLYSQEYIYSSMSPVSSMEALDSEVTALSGNSITVNSGASVINFGDILYLKDSNNDYYLLGVVRGTVGSTGISLIKDSYITSTTIKDGITFTNLSSNPRLYRSKAALLMGKSLSNYYGLDGATTMEGTADKGYVFNSGRLIGYTADNSLLRDVQSSNKLNGFAINEIIGGYARTGQANQYRDNPYGITNLDLHATDASFHTISSLVEYDIIRPQTSFKINSKQTVYNIGYVSPVVAGTVYGNNRNEDWLDLQATTSGRLQDSFYLVNGQGLQDGGFIHLLDNEMDITFITGSTSVKAPKTFANKFSEDPSNSGSSKNQYGIMFGTPIWRYTNKHEGDIKQTLSTLGSIRPQVFSPGTNGRTRHRNDYYESNATFNFSLSSYRTTADNIFANDHYSATLALRKHKSTPIERSGSKPALGSRFFDVTRYPAFWGSADDSNLSLRINTNEVARAHSYYEAWDSRAGPLHLFLPGDIYPESQSQWNNLDFSQISRNITDYSIILKKEQERTDTLTHFSPTYPTNWEGAGQIGNKKDSDYEVRNITASSGNRNRFNLVRMTEVVFDMMMNEVDYENYEINNTGTEMTDEICQGQMVTKHHLATEVATFTSIAGSTLTLNTDSWFDGSKTQHLYYQKANDRLFFIGEVTGNPTTNQVTVSFTYEPDEYTSSLTSGDKIWLIEKVTGQNVDVITTNEGQHIPIVNSGLRDIRNATAAFTHDNPIGSNGEIMKLNAQKINGYMRRPMIKETASTALQTNAFNFHRLTYDGQVGVNFYDYHDLDVIIMKAKRLPGEPNSHIQDFRLSEIVGATDRDSASPIDEVITVTPAAQVGTYTTFQLLDSRATNPEDSAFLGNETSPLNKTRAVELLFRPRFDGFSIYTSSDDSTLSSDERIIYIDINHDYDGGVPRSSGSSNSWVNYCNNLAGYYIGDSTNGELHYIKSHEISKADGTIFRHFLKIDNCSGGLTLDKDLHLMKIAHDCMYDFSPNKILLNDLSSRYTKIPGQNKMHEGENFSVVDASQGEPTKSSAGILSGYYLIEIDGNDDGYLITRDITNLTFTNSFALDTVHNMHITDGINSYQTPVLLESEGATPHLKYLSLSTVRAMKGTPSFGSIFTVTVNSPAEFIPTKASIGASLNIVYEAEDIIDDVLTNIGVDFNQSDVSNTYYVAQNFTGENVYAAANSVLRFKDKKLQVLGTDVNIVSDEETKNYRDIEFSEDSTDYKITMLKKDKSLFDSFNVVEVYGDGIKSVVKNYQKIKKTGREKVKEVFDYTISSQKDADLIARRLLKIYSEDNFAIQINVGSDIPFMQPGQIVSVYFPSEGIFRSEYIVIEIEREFGQPTKLKLGEYNRELSNTMSLLLSETRNLQGRTKLGSYNSVRIPNINLQSLRVKFVKAEVTNLTDDTTSTIGFGYTIGFNSEVSP